MNAEAINTNMPVEQEPSSFRLIITLGIAGFLSGLILVSVYLFTKPYIEQNKADALKTAIFKVLPGTTDFEELKIENGTLTSVSEADKDANSVFRGFNADGNTVGFAILGAQAGFQDIIVVLCGYNSATGKIIGYEVLESKETPGLGDKIFKDAAFQENFKALEVSPEIVAVKKGEKANPNEVETITGATISSKTVINLLNNSMAAWKTPIDAYMKNETNE